MMRGKVGRKERKKEKERRKVKSTKQKEREKKGKNEKQKGKIVGIKKGSTVPSALVHIHSKNSHVTMTYVTGSAKRYTNAQAMVFLYKSLLF